MRVFFVHANWTSVAGVSLTRTNDFIFAMRLHEKRNAFLAKLA